MHNIIIIIPAYNEAARIGKTLDAYLTYFEQLQQEKKLAFECVVVLNGCSDNTLEIVQKKQQGHDALSIINLKEAGKGLAIATGFKHALKRDNDLIGFVDADMATKPSYFYDLITCIGNNDGVIASRYMKNSIVIPPRPSIKKWGRKLVYHSLIRLLFGLGYKDFQCGAKVFNKKAVAKIAPDLSVKQWAFDVELLYLCKKCGFIVKEVPTVWHDQTGSKLKIMSSGLPMLGSLFALRFRHSPFYRWFV